MPNHEILTCYALILSIFQSFPEWCSVILLLNYIALLIVLFPKAKLSSNSKSYLLLPFSEIKNLFIEDWSQLYPALPNICLTCMCVCVCVCVCVCTSSFLSLSRKGTSGSPNLPATWRIFQKDPELGRLSLSLRTTGGKDKMWNKVERPRSTLKWIKLSGTLIFFIVIGGRALAFLPCLR